MSLRGAAPVFWIPAGPKAASTADNPVARMTDRNNGAGTVESRRGFIIPASKGSHRNRIAQPSIADVPIVRMMKWPRNGANGEFVAFSESVACVQRQAADLRTPAGSDISQKSDDVDL